MIGGLEWREGEGVRASLHPPSPRVQQLERWWRQKIPFFSLRLSPFPSGCSPFSHPCQLLVITAVLWALAPASSVCQLPPWTLSSSLDSALLPFGGFLVLQPSCAAGSLGEFVRLVQATLQLQHFWLSRLSQWDLRFCLSSKFEDDAYTTGQGTALGEFCRWRIYWMDSGEHGRLLHTALWLSAGRGTLLMFVSSR